MAPKNQRPRFEVFAGSVLIGYSELETGDAPMGVATGRFLPLPSYKAVQPAVIACRDGSQAHLFLGVHTSEGDELPAQGGVQITDCSTELGAEGMEVRVSGIGFPLYETLFPAHVAAYEAQFPKRNHFSFKRKVAVSAGVDKLMLAGCIAFVALFVSTLPWLGPGRNWLMTTATIALGALLVALLLRRWKKRLPLRYRGSELKFEDRPTAYHVCTFLLILFAAMMLFAGLGAAVDDIRNANFTMSTRP